MNTAWFYHRDSAQELGAPGGPGAVMTLALFGCSLVLTACFFAWVPRRTMWFTALGAGTLYGYLLHGFLVKGAEYGGWFDHAWVHEPLGEIVVTVAAAALITVLCTRPVQRIFRFAMEPKMAWAFKGDPAEAARERAKAGASRPRSGRVRRHGRPTRRHTRRAGPQIRAVSRGPRTVTRHGKDGPVQPGGSPSSVAHRRVLLGQAGPGVLVEDREPARVGVVRQVGRLDQQGAPGGADAPRVRLRGSPVPFGERQHDVLRTRGQRGLVQPVLGEGVVLDGVVQPGGRYLVVVAAALADAVRDGLEVLGVRPARLVGLGGVRRAGERFDFGQGQERLRHAISVSSVRAAAAALPKSVGRGQRTGVRPSRQISSSARSSLTSLATASIRCQAAPWKPPAT